MLSSSQVTWSQIAPPSGLAGHPDVTAANDLWPSRHEGLRVVGIGVE